MQNFVNINPKTWLAWVIKEVRWQTKLQYNSENMVWKTRKNNIKIVAHWDVVNILTSLKRLQSIIFVQCTNITSSQRTLEIITKLYMAKGKQIKMVGHRNGYQKQVREEAEEPLPQPHYKYEASRERLVL